MKISKTGGSDSPIPYTVDGQGITLPEGETFPAHGHVNIKYSTPDAAANGGGIHFDPNNNQPGGAWIGESFIPWSAFELEPGDCVTWVQIHGYNQHFGEGGQDEICVVEPSEDEEPEDETPPVDEDPEEEEPPMEEEHPDPLPPEFECPEGTIPGWLGPDGEPTSCINDNVPLPEIPEDVFEAAEEYGQKVVDSLLTDEVIAEIKASEPTPPEAVETAAPGFDMTGVALFGVVLAAMLVRSARGLTRFKKQW